MIKDVLHHEPNSSFVLLYGNKTPEDTIFYNEIESLKKEFFGRFYVYYTYTQVNEQEEFEMFELISVKENFKWIHSGTNRRKR